MKTSSETRNKQMLQGSDPRSLAGRPLKKSAKLGQVVTPPEIATRMVTRLFAQRGTKPVAILDPCVGPQTFPEQIYRSGMLNPDDSFTLVDLDEDMISSSKEWAVKRTCRARFIRDDYLCVPMNCEYDFAVLNPPYIRQEWLEKKYHYQETFKTRYDLKVPGTSNLYVYFIVKVLRDLKPGGQVACVVYDSWQSTIYGKWLQGFLRTECDDLEIEPSGAQPFDGRLIDATLIYAKKRITKVAAHQQTSKPALIFENKGDKSSPIEGFAPITDVYDTNRGLRLKQAKFFLGDVSLHSKIGATPFIKKVAKVSGYAVPDNHPEAALLLESPSGNKKILFELLRRLSASEKAPEQNVSILTWYKERPNSWMTHPRAPRAPILFNYYLRNRPRHIYNPDRAYSDNFYGLIMKNGISPLAALASLNSTAVCAAIFAGARNQGNGLAKIQLFEYRQVCVPNLMKCSKSDIRRLDQLGRRLISSRQSYQQIITQIDMLLYNIFNHPRLHPARAKRLYETANLQSCRPKET